MQAFGQRPIVRIVDVEAVVRNYQLFRQKVGKTNTICAAVLKADVHGAKMELIAPALYETGCRHFFVEELCEGIQLRKILPFQDAKIFAMAGLLDGEETYFLRYRIAPCLNCLEQIRRWNECCKGYGGKSAVIHLDTHMNRIGLLDDEVEELSRHYGEWISDFDVEFYMSHFYDIKGDDPTHCYEQLAVLQQYLKKLPKRPVSFACTDSTILLDNTIFNFDMVRIGIGLVGGAPNKAHPIDPSAKGAIEIYVKISQIKSVKKGQTIGYGGSYTAKRDMRIALAHIGYKDGYLRSLSEKDDAPVGAYLWIAGYPVSVVGKISLGMTTIDVTDVPEEVLQKYRYAEVIGPNVDIKELADIAGCYELLASLGRLNTKIADYTLEEIESIGEMCARK
ncbi:MAG: alanine racemase [Bacillota bacterium]